jgi:hypothetical protein
VKIGDVFTFHLLLLEWRTITKQSGDGSDTVVVCVVSLM